ncbi:MAG: hypothetical protein CML03_00380 [Pseudooceanicola sp.]|jgi:hypothetical protein|nr:hypothetical protein [Pseudooceanicola sp.]|tara:strand:- start:69 stop:428 length:360 start_codon:yes stop_codon:yes gene_type:complete
MKIISKVEICAAVPHRWADQYKNYGPHHEKQKIGQRLLALKPEERTAEIIDAIIGNGSWTTNTCDSCGKDCETLVRIGEEPDYDARWQDLCRECLIAGVELFDTTRKSPDKGNQTPRTC